MKIKIITLLLILGPNLFWGLKLYGQDIKVTYQASAKTVNNSNPKTNNILEQIAKRVNSVLPRIDFVAETDNNYNKVYYENSMSADFERERVLDLAVSIALDSDGIFVDYKKGLAYYEPSMINKVRRVQTDNIKWLITKETKNILDFKCYKAYGEIVDAKAENKLTPPTIAWFCPDLVVRGGPTAYATLPGMILELENLKAKFVAKKIEFKEDLKLEEPGYKSENILSHKEWTEYFESNNPIRTNKN